MRSASDPPCPLPVLDSAAMSETPTVSCPICRGADVDVVAVRQAADRPEGYSLEWVHVDGRRCGAENERHRQPGLTGATSPL